MLGYSARWYLLKTEVSHNPALTTEIFAALGWVPQTWSTKWALYNPQHPASQLFHSGGESLAPCACEAVGTEHRFLGVSVWSMGSRSDNWWQWNNWWQALRSILGLCLCKQSAPLGGRCRWKSTQELQFLLFFFSRRPKQKKGVSPSKGPSDPFFLCWSF